MEHRYSTYLVFGLFVIFIVASIMAWDTGDVNTLCSVDGSVLQRIAGIWTCSLYVKFGTNTSTSPIRIIGQRLVSKSLVSSGANTGALEYANNTLYFTNWKVRRTVVQSQNVLISNVSVTNTATETVLYNQPHGADYLITGKMEDILLIGRVNTGSAVNDGGTIIIRYAGSQIGNFSIPKTLNQRAIEIHVLTTTRSTGAGTTSIQLHANADIEGVTADPVINTLKNGLDSTTQQNTTISIKWGSASNNNRISITQGRALSIDNNQQS